MTTSSNTSPLSAAYSPILQDKIAALRANVANISKKADMNNCPFCNLDNSRILMTNSHALAILDAFPVSSCHTLIIPRRHIPSFFDATREEQAAMFNLVSARREQLMNLSQSTLGKGEDAPTSPDGFNIGINDGEAAGQTIMHLHIHLIPRYAGDRQDPRGGVRWIMPEKAVYWK